MSSGSRLSSHFWSRSESPFSGAKSTVFALSITRSSTKIGAQDDDGHVGDRIHHQALDRHFDLHVRSSYQLPATSYQLPATSDQLPAASCELPARRVH